MSFINKIILAHMNCFKPCIQPGCLWRDSDSIIFVKFFVITNSFFKISKKCGFLLTARFITILSGAFRWPQSRSLRNRYDTASWNLAFRKTFHYRRSRKTVRSFPRLKSMNIAAKRLCQTRRVHITYSYKLIWSAQQNI